MSDPNATDEARDTHEQERARPQSGLVPAGASDAPDEAPPFVVVSFGERTWVVDLVDGAPARVGSSPSADIRLDDPSVEPSHCAIAWSDPEITLEVRPDAPVYHAGRLAEHSVAIHPGEEITVGPAQLVVGVPVPLTAVGRRTFTHPEFRERLYEEMARAARGGRPTALAMVQARPGEGANVAAAAIEAFRAGDVVGTYAPDAPELLLPDTDLETAVGVLDRVLHRLDTAVGLAVAPEDGDNPERLMAAACAALTQAMREGGGIASPPAQEACPPAPAMHDETSQEIVRAVEALAPKSTSVLLTGEISTGKSRFARLLHERGRTPGGPFVSVMCAGLYETEAMDAALGDERGAVEPAALGATGGTLFLDEVGDLSTDGQARLRELLTRHPGAFRVVSTTQRAIGGLVERGAFDPTLYEQLSADVLEIPPLRSRPDDIVPLATHFAEHAGIPRPVPFSPGAVARLRSYPWPGNVLELRNAIERAVRIAGSGEILAEHLPNEPMPVSASKGKLREHVDSVERDAIVKALADSNHNQTHAARRLGISRRALIYKMEKYGLKRPPRTTPPK